MKKFFLYFSMFFLSYSCSNDYTPKPRAYFRIDFPKKKEYQIYRKNCPFEFEYSKYSEILTHSKNKPCWFNILYEKYKAKIHISYKRIDMENDISKYLEDSRKLAYKHTIKADAIGEQLFEDDEKNVYGMFFDIQGNTASSVQFYLTDSTEHFLRGSLYFNVSPNKDSLRPVIEFIKKDIFHLIETFNWKKN